MVTMGTGFPSGALLPQLMKMGTMVSLVPGSPPPLLGSMGGGGVGGGVGRGAWEGSMGGERGS